MMEVKGFLGWGGEWGLRPPFLLSNFPALHSRLDSRHLQEQADSCTLSEDGSHIGHNLSVLTQVEGGRNSGPRCLKGASIVVVAWEP